MKNSGNSARVHAVHRAVSACTQRGAARCGAVRAARRCVSSVRACLPLRETDGILH